MSETPNDTQEQEFDRDAPYPVHESVRNMMLTIRGFLNKAQINGEEAEALVQGKNLIAQIAAGEVVMMEQKQAMEMRNAQYDLEQFTRGSKKTEE